MPYDYLSPLPPEEQRHQLKKQFVRNTAVEIAFIGLFTGAFLLLLNLLDGTNPLRK